MRNGLKTKYKIARADGSSADPEGVYLVLELNSTDRPHARACRLAARCYAHEINDYLPELSEDIANLCDQIEKVCGESATPAKGKGAR